MESIVGKILCDRYRITQELNRDAVSTVYLAEDLEQSARELYEIERLQPQYDREVLGEKSWQKVRQTFMEEGNLLQNVSQHPQIPLISAYFECDREFYVVREHITGESLAQKIERALITEAEAVAWLQEILAVLEFIHRAGVNHLNIQPSSLIQHQDGRKFLVDFAGIKYSVACDLASFSTITNPNFVSPQQSAKPDLCCDIFALGKTVIYALTGKVARSISAQSEELENNTELSQKARVTTAKIAPELATVLNKMVGERAAVRYQSATEVLAELNFERDVVTLPPPFFDPLHSIPRASVRKRSKINSAMTVGRSKWVHRVIWFLLTLPFLIASVIIFIGIDKNSYRNFVSYTNDDYQFQLKYPQSWTRRELNDPITGEIVVFTSPAETDTDLFREKVYVTTEHLPPEPINLEEYTQTVVRRISQAKDSEVEIYEDFATKIDQFPARTVVYSRQDEGLQLRQMEVFTIRNNRVYIAIYTAERAKFSKFFDTVEQIIDSWRIQ